MQVTFTILLACVFLIKDCGCRYCYTCTDTTELCNVTVTCPEDQVCHLEIQETAGKTTYSLGCQDMQLCLDTERAVVGRDAGVRHRREENVICHECCDGDLCNQDLCAREMEGDCLAIQANNNSAISGVYTVQLAGLGPTEVYCDMATDRGGWTVFQKRYDGSVNFTRTFSEYENGFGDLHREFWLGLKVISSMLEESRSELRIDLLSANLSTAYEVFPDFSLGPSPNYTLHIGNGIGPAEDRWNDLTYNNGSQFYTVDRDNSFRCAQEYGGGWWYEWCSPAQLNGEYRIPGTVPTSGNYAGMIYYSFRGHESLKSSKMMFRRMQQN